MNDGSISKDDQDFMEQYDQGLIPDNLESLENIDKLPGSITSVGKKVSYHYLISS